MDFTTCPFCKACTVYLEGREGLTLSYHHHHYDSYIVTKEGSIHCSICHIVSDLKVRKNHTRFSLQLVEGEMIIGMNSL